MRNKSLLRSSVSAFLVEVIGPNNKADESVNKAVDHYE